MNSNNSSQDGEAPKVVSMAAFKTAKKGEEGIPLRLLDVNGDPTPAVLTILSSDSTAFRKEDTKISREILLAQAARGNKELSDDEDFTQREARRLRLISALVTGWNFTDEDGEPVPFTREACVAWLKESPVAFRQINEAAADRKRFLEPTPGG